MDEKLFHINGAVQTDKFKNEDEFMDAFLDWVKSFDGLFGGIVAEDDEDEDKDEYPSYSFMVNIKNK